MDSALEHYIDKWDCKKSSKRVSKLQKSIELKEKLLKEKKGKEKGEKREKMRSKYSADKSR